MDAAVDFNKSLVVRHATIGTAGGFTLADRVGAVTNRDSSTRGVGGIHLEVDWVV